MKVCVLSSYTGGGHHAAAEAIQEVLIKRGVEVQIIDVLMLASPVIGKVVLKLFEGVITYTPSVFGMAYKAGEKISNGRILSIIYYLNSLYRKRLFEFLVHEGIECVVCTHLFGAQAITAVEKKYGKHFKTIAIATDYTCIPFWEETRLDEYIIPHEELKKEFEQKGIPPQKLYALGIPVKEKFYRVLAPEMAKEQLGLRGVGALIGVMSGSIGSTQLESTIKVILENFPGLHILVVCGKNEEQYQALQLRFKENGQVNLLKYTLHPEYIMQAVEVLITKPGGLTSTEALIQNVPIIHISPIPGCETKNAQFFSERGMSIYATNEVHLCEELEILLKSEIDRVHMQKRQQKYRKWKASEWIAERIMADYNK